MSQTSTESNSFIEYLEGLASREERGALAALRRGLGNPPGTTVEMFRYVEPFLPERRRAEQEAAYYLVAALFALHPKSTRQGNFGNHMAAIRKEGDDDALERRFTVLLAAHPDDLPNYLRQAVGVLKYKECPIHWVQLLRDIQFWDLPDRRVQKAWARSFWGKSSQMSENQTN